MANGAAAAHRAGNPNLAQPQPAEQNQQAGNQGRLGGMQEAANDHQPRHDAQGGRSMAAPSNNRRILIGAALVTGTALAGAGVCLAASLIPGGWSAIGAGLETFGHMIWDNILPVAAVTASAIGFTGVAASWLMKSPRDEQGIPHEHKEFSWSKAIFSIAWHAGTGAATGAAAGLLGAGIGAIPGAIVGASFGFVTGVLKVHHHNCMRHADNRLLQEHNNQQRA